MKINVINNDGFISTYIIAGLKSSDLSRKSSKNFFISCQFFIKYAASNSHPNRDLKKIKTKNNQKLIFYLLEVL